MIRLAVVDAKRRKILKKADVAKLIEYRRATGAQRALVVVPCVTGQPPCKVQRGAKQLADAEHVEIEHLVGSDPAGQNTRMAMLAPKARTRPARKVAGRTKAKSKSSPVARPTGKPKTARHRSRSKK